MFWLNEVFGCLEEFVYVFEELGAVGTVCDSVVDGECQIHEFSHDDMVTFCDAFFCNSAQAEYAALAWQGYGCE